MNIWYFHPYAGGPGIGKFDRPYHLPRHWKTLGHDAVVFVASFHHLLEKREPLPPETMVEGVRYVALKVRPYTGNGLSRLLNMADYCRAMIGLANRTSASLLRPDTIVASSPHPFVIYPAWYLARKFNAKLVFEVRDLWPLSITELNGTPAWHPLVIAAGHAERFAYRHADLVGSLLGGAEPHMRTKGLASGKFVYVPNGVAGDDVDVPMSPTSEPGRQAAAQIVKWRNEQRVVLLYAGAQGPPNGLERLLDAVALLRTRGLDGQLSVLLVGDGVLTDTLKRQAKALSLDDVVFVPPVPKREALWIISQSDIAYAGGRNHKAIYRYGLSFNKIMDYMHLGLPVILPIDITTDPVSESGGGLVTRDDSPEAIADAIDALVKIGDEQRLAMGKKGQDYIREVHNYSKIARNYVEAIDAV